MKKILLLTTFSVILSFTLFAQTKQEKITELMVLMHQESTLDAILESTTSIFATQTMGSKNPVKDSIYRAFAKEETLALVKKNNEKRMLELYEKYFTIEEIQKYIDFYKSPEGQKMLTTMPAITKEIMANTMANDMPELRARLKKKLEELYPN
jgi:uncharacterized protein